METRKPPSARRSVGASHDSDSPAALIEFMSSHWAESRSAAHPMPQAERFAGRRAAFSAAFPGTFLVVAAGTEKVRANDTHFRFRTSSDFAYLIGPGEPGALLVLEPHGDRHESVLFVPPHNRGGADFFTNRAHGELWVGRHRGVEESCRYYGVERALPIGDIEQYLRDLRSSGADVAIVRGDDHRIDAAFDAAPRDGEASAHLAEMRLIKDAYEIGELRTCMAISKRAFEDVLRLFPRLRSEREVEAAFWSRARVEANDVGYLTIAAAGSHACTLHWNHNHGTVERGDLLLLDAGVEVESLYTADITRTLPVSGSFTAEQRAVYEIVFEAQRAGFAAVRPGNDFLEPNRAAMRVLAQGLIDLRVLRCSLDEALDPEKQFYRRYTLHNVSHMLGIDVHDCAKARAKTYRYGSLHTGMVLTVEPGLYFQPDDETVPQHFRGIGVRIEDDVLVTPDGFENLSAALPSESHDVEAWIGECRGSHA